MGVLNLKNIFTGFCHIWAWQPSWSIAQDNFYNLMFPLFQGGSTYNLALIDTAVLEKTMFENNGHIHVYSPKAETENQLGSFVFQKG